MTVALPPTLIALAKATAEQRDPAGVFRAAEAASRALIGHRLFTVLFVMADGTEVERIFSSDPAAYPLTGRKQMGPTPWGDHVLRQARPWLGNDMDAIRWAFPDHALIESLGCGACVNIPVREGGVVVGTMNILNAAGHFAAHHLDAAEVIGGFLPGAIRRAADQTTA